MDYLSRTRLLIGDEGLKKLASSHVAIFGVGGVGGAALEALVRSGIKEVSLIDNDIICLSNLNRQIIATRDNISKSKVDEFSKRIKSISEDIIVHSYPIFFSKENIDEIPFADFDYILDCIDTVSSKIALIKLAYELNIPIISSMGAANKMNPNQFIVSDIYKTEMDPLAKILRHELRKLGIKKLKVIYSKEPPIAIKEVEEDDFCPYKDICKDKCLPSKKRKAVGSNAFTPTSAGLLLASEVVKDIIK